MPFPVILIMGIKALLVTVAVGAVIAILAYSTIVNWFRERTALKEQDKQNIAFTLQEHLHNGNVKTVQGIFNTQNNTLLDSKGYQSKNIDEDLANIHNGEELVVYT